ncbi:MAG: class I SAM-dependent methyltransferase [Bacteroidales bacterium]|jgi:23S rRNA (cytosine1962-C5)-methyltransferase|nr:class I SAM-dependent methyltransferase [Bacteroidales bacterium]HOL98729.1 class I SAM-dependent methyltransferase [Bacteroidales bacterium]HOM36963.1 class I SAM-dependent methyltransferase [Bacteroidales bacterium]HPD24614.1 class I SAM-dependent methyltransferase [Bacteroidales bacterium]HRT00362.1 class I SAM-dependent methyltransferase [Bacteroidales bacterium]
MKIELNSLFPQYKLIDCGSGKKLEQFGNYVLIRPEITAKDHARLSYEEWQNIAHAEFFETDKALGYWQKIKEMPDTWQISFFNSVEIILTLALTGSKHTGLFPEQVLNWSFILENSKYINNSEVLNLFGYTGSTSVFAANFAGRVTHVDSVKKVVDRTRLNAQDSGVSNIRFIVDDAVKFVKKDIKRQKKYKMIILDPPAIGIGVKNEKWILNDMLEDLLLDVRELLDEESFLIMNIYSHEISDKHLYKIFDNIFSDFDKLLFDKIYGKSSTGNFIDHGYFIQCKRGRY